MSYPANASALLEFRKPEVFDPMKRYPPSAIWQQSSRRRQIKLPRGRKQLTKKVPRRNLRNLVVVGQEPTQSKHKELEVRD